MLIFVNIYKALASILITNSHFGNIYPNSVSFLAMGGALGNCMFFVCSGYLTIGGTTSESKLIPWIKKKVLRIYPSVWIVTLLYYFFNNELVINKKGIELIVPFIFPTMFWFINAIIVMYIIGFIIQKYFMEHIKRVIIVLILIYLVIIVCVVQFDNYNTEYNYTKCAYYGIAMIIGMIIHKNVKQIASYFEIHKVLALLMTVFGFILYGIGSIFTHKPNMLKYQPIMHIGIIICSVFLFCLLMTYEQKFKKTEMNTIFFIVSKMSASTLEIYLLNDLVVEKLNLLPFPINFICSLLVIFVGGISLHFFVDAILKYVIKKNTCIKNNTN